MVPVLLPIHIVAAGLGLVFGFLALFAGKGGTLHRRTGLVFVYAMVLMCGSAVVMAVAKGQITNVVAGVLTGYLAVTALTTFRPRSPAIRSLELGLTLLAVTFGVVMVTFGFEALASPGGRKFGLPSFPFFLFGAIGLLGSLGDYRMIRSGGLRGAARLRRHLWRMCTALLIATASFVSIRSRVARVLPEAFISPAARTVPVMIVFAMMFYWLWRVRVKRTASGTRSFDVSRPVPYALSAGAPQR
jgi:hypothetical protein